MTFAVSMKKSKSIEKRLGKLGEKLKKLRIKSGYKSAETFAYDNELNRVQYWRMEKGANFTLLSLMRVLDMHKITLEEFFKGAD